MKLLQKLRFSSDKVVVVAKRRSDEMRKLSFEQLSLLPKVHEDSEFIENNKIQIATYNDVLEDERRRIVVQALFTRMLGIGIIAADGFIRSYLKIG
jgi:hypothetical protein